MLFDLQGKRRRVVQATYLTLAVLMGGGLVLFGIGGEVSGGLFDAFSDRSGGTGSDVVEERVDRNEERIKRRPRDTEVRAELVRDYYSLASVQTPEGATSFSEDARDELARASVHWEAYLDAAKGKVDPTVASIALRMYDPSALNKPDQALRVARLIAERGKDSGSYLQLMQYAALAGDNRTMQLAQRRALELAGDPQTRKAVADQIKQIQQAVVAQQVQQGDVEIQPKGKGGNRRGSGGNQQGGGGN